MAFGTFIVGVGVGFGLATTSSYVISYRSRVEKIVLEEQSVWKKKLDVPTPEETVIYISENFALGYNNRLRVSTWAYQKLTKESLVVQSADRNNSSFREDKRIPEIFRSKLKDYQYSGFDRGHLVPAADLKKDQEEMDESFRLTNIAPQDPWLNRVYWANVEKFVRDLCGMFDEVHTGEFLRGSNCSISYKFMYTVTGPLFIPNKKNWMNYQVLGENQVAVPTHFYKVVAAKSNRSKHTYFGAFCVPNKRIEETTPLSNFVVPISHIERHSGHLMFPRFAQILEDKGTHRIRQIEKEKHLCDEVKCELKQSRMKQIAQRIMK